VIIQAFCKQQQVRWPCALWPCAAQWSPQASISNVCEIAEGDRPSLELSLDHFVHQDDSARHWSPTEPRGHVLHRQNVCSCVFLTISRGCFVLSPLFFLMAPRINGRGFAGCFTWLWLSCICFYFDSFFYSVFRCELFPESWPVGAGCQALVGLVDASVAALR